MFGHDHTDQAPERQIRRGSTRIKKEKREIMRFLWTDRNLTTNLALSPVFFLDLKLELNSYNVSTSYASDKSRGLSQDTS